MDQRTQYARLKTMIESLDKHKKTITIHELTSLISMNITSTPKTIENAMRTMGMTGLIKDIGESKFKIIRK